MTGPIVIYERVSYLFLTAGLRIAPVSVISSAGHHSVFVSSCCLLRNFNMVSQLQLPQILDDGRVTDTQGHTISFKNTLIIMTSNLGSAEIFQADVAKNRVAIKQKVMDHVRTHFRPEFINRVDDFITFDPLRMDQIKQIVHLRSQRCVLCSDGGWRVTSTSCAAPFTNRCSLLQQVSYLS